VKNQGSQNEQWGARLGDNIHTLPAGTTVVHQFPHARLARPETSKWDFLNFILNFWAHEQLVLAIRYDNYVFVNFGYTNPALFGTINCILLGTRKYHILVISISA
jgi:hypothetical protein